MKHRFINGRRGGFLLLFGICYGMVGYGYSLQTVRPPQLSWIPIYVPSLQLDLLVPLKIIAAGWLLAGLLAIVCAFFPRPKDRLGFQALTFITVLWGFFSLIAFIAGTDPNGIISAIIYLVLGGAVMIVSGMSGPNDRDLRPIILDGEELIPPATTTGPQEIVGREPAAGEDADGTA